MSRCYLPQLSTPDTFASPHSLFPNVLKQLILATAPKIVGRIPRRTVAIGLTRVLCELPGLLDEPQAETWCARVAVSSRS